jgi:hypothetical protein
MKFQYIRVSFLLIASLLTFSECNKQLDLRPLGQLDEFTFYQTEKDFEAASLSPYSTLQNFYFNGGADDQLWNSVVQYPDDDETVANNDPNAREDFNWLPNDPAFELFWKECYKGIQRANVILDRLPVATKFTDATRKARFEAEAKFMRAYFHFLLAINFGTPPISDKAISTVEEARKPNSAPGEIWNLIISDLQFAKQNLPADWDASNKGRVTSGASAGLLGKVYLYRAQWENNTGLYTDAANELAAVVASGKYSLVPNFADNFDPNKENNAESLFEVQFVGGDANPWLPNDFGAAGDENVGSSGTATLLIFRPSCGPTGNTACAPDANGLGYGRVHVTSPLQNAFETGDPRRPQTIYKQGDDFKGVPYQAAWSVTGSTPAKYVKQENLDFRFPLNISTDNARVIRYADVLLMLAEARLLGSNDIGGAATLINQVRRRADPTGLILADRSSAVSKDQMFAWLRQERRVELAFEGHRYFDLVRWHRANLINIKTDIDFGRVPANQNWSLKHLLKPIPQRELDLNSNLRQNSDYL